MNDNLIDNGEEISKELNNYFSLVFSHEELYRELEPEQIFRRQEADRG